MRLEQRLGAGDGAREVLERITHLAETLEPTLAELNIVNPEELAVGTLFERMSDEVVANHSLVRSHLQVGAWSRT